MSYDRSRRYNPFPLSKNGGLAPDLFTKPKSMPFAVDTLVYVDVEFELVLQPQYTRYNTCISTYNTEVTKSQDNIVHGFG